MSLQSSRRGSWRFKYSNQNKTLFGPILVPFWSPIKKFWSTFWSPFGPLFGPLFVPFLVPYRFHRRILFGRVLGSLFGPSVWVSVPACPWLTIKRGAQVFKNIRLPNPPIAPFYIKVYARSAAEPDAGKSHTHAVDRDGRARQTHRHVNAMSFGIQASQT